MLFRKRSRGRGCRFGSRRGWWDAASFFGPASGHGAGEGALEAVLIFLGLGAAFGWGAGERRVIFWAGSRAWRWRPRSAASFFGPVPGQGAGEGALEAPRHFSGMAFSHGAGERRVIFWAALGTQGALEAPRHFAVAAGRDARPRRRRAPRHLSGRFSNTSAAENKHCGKQAPRKTSAAENKRRGKQALRKTSAASKK